MKLHCIHTECNFAVFLGQSVSLLINISSEPGGGTTQMHTLTGQLDDKFESPHGCIPGIRALSSGLNF